MEKLNRYLRALLAIALCAGLLVPTNLTAWGPEGHIVIATIANARLTPAARAAVRQLLGRHSLASVANFADQIRPQRPETANWHFVDIPKGETNYDPGRDCQPSPKGDCVIAAIARAETALKDRSLPRKQRAEALKFLVHFVGDLHQPLHWSDNHDRGGNDVNVSFLDARRISTGYGTAALSGKSICRLPIMRLNSIPCWIPRTQALWRKARRWTGRWRRTSWRRTTRTKFQITISWM